MSTKKTRRPPMSRAEAERIFDNAVKRLAAERGVDYPAALLLMGKERPELVRAYQFVSRRKAGN